MNLTMDVEVARNYKSNSQKIRVITETWVKNNMFCPCCGNSYINHFANNRPVADFFCSSCGEEYELKSKSGSIASKVNDGAYTKMIERIESANNPNFFFLHYNLSDMRVKNLIMVPKYFFSADIIEKRKPLADTAQRAGWVGCNIVLEKIPEYGKIFIVKDEVEQPVNEVISKARRKNFVSQYSVDAGSWTVDVLDCVNMINSRNFTLKQMYQFEELLSSKHPENHHIREKIRQQLQILRDRGIIEFNGRGHYHKI